MPIYEYQCPQCGKVFEDWVQLSDAAATRPCPGCGAAARHILSNTSFVLKGGGWYVTEYGNRKNDPDANAATTSGKAPAGDAAGGTPAGDVSTGGTGGDKAPAAPVAVASGQAAGGVSGQAVGQAAAH